MKQQTITSLPPSPDSERRSRVFKYSVAMSIRVLCIFAMLFVHGWWLIVPALGAVLLPYFAVVIANNVQKPPSSNVVSPTLELGSAVPMPSTFQKQPADSSDSAVQ